MSQTTSVRIADFRVESWNLNLSGTKKVCMNSTANVRLGDMTKDIRIVTIIVRC